jgi:hypothetical protein
MKFLPLANIMAIYYKKRLTVSQLNTMIPPKNMASLILLVLRLSSSVIDEI